MSIFKKHKKIIVALIIIVFLLFTAFIGKQLFTNNSTNLAGTKFITANPVDLAQIKSISAFRSCAGHDYSAYNTGGEKENLRSMKHYLNPIDELAQSRGKIKVFAPFDGEINNIDKDRGPENIQRGKQIWLEPNSARDWYFVFFHIDLISGLDEKSEISAGQLIGYADLTNAGNFDYTVKKSTPLKGPNIISSPILHMNDEMLSEYENYGINKDNFILSKDYRDLNPCKIVPGTESEHDTIFDASAEIENDWVILQSPI